MSNSNVSNVSNDICDSFSHKCVKKHFWISQRYQMRRLNESCRMRQWGVWCTPYIQGGKDTPDPLWRTRYLVAFRSFANSLFSQKSHYLRKETVRKRAKRDCSQKSHYVRKETVCKRAKRDCSQKSHHVRKEIRYPVHLFFAKEPLFVGLLCAIWPIKIRHPMRLRHPIHLPYKSAKEP